MKAAKIGSRFYYDQQKMATIRKNDKQVYHSQPIIHNKEALLGGVPCCSSEFTSLSEIEQKFFGI